MSPESVPPIQRLADKVIQSDVAAQQSVGEWEKGTWIRTTQIATGGGDWVKKAVALVAAIAVLLFGIFAGYSFLNNQPTGTAQPTLIAAPPSGQPTPVTATPVIQTPGPTPVTATPVITTPAPVITPVPILLPDGVGEILTDDPDDYEDDDDDQDPEGPDDPDVGSKPGTELTGGYVGPAEVSGGQAMAMVDSWVAGTVTSDRVEELWPCTDANVICGPAQLDPGDYFVIGFSTAAPPPIAGTENIYQVYYLMTDLDGDWLNNAYVTPPLTNYIYLSSQYVVEGGWFGTVKGLGETDYRGPIGPDGQTPRYNTTPESRLVLADDPAGGFFIVPQDHVGDWFRIATMWRDFGTTERNIAVDALGAFGGLEMIPVPGRAELPTTLECVRVNVVAEQLDENPSQLDVMFQVQDGVTLDPAAVANLTLLTGTSPTEQGLVEHPDLALEDRGNGAFRFHVGVGSATTQGFSELTVGVAGSEVDVTDEFRVLGGAGVNIPPGFSGYAFGNTECGT